MSSLDKWRRLEEEAREIRRREANWSFIESQPPRLRAALKYYIETGDLYVASRIAGLTIEEFNELRKKAGIPNVS
uniref:PaREP6 n=1 Tax=Ignisphaera aggregans TaxID=334771 RepID=A0A7J3Z629_9CREN